MPDWYGGPSRLPVMELRNIPRYETYRVKLEKKWHRKGYQVRFV